MLQLKVVEGTLSSQKNRAEILESDVIPSLNSPESQNMLFQDAKHDQNVFASSNIHKTFRTSLVFHGRACRRTLTLSNTCGTSSANAFESK